jgi:NodT family efflux transporter outer membrane factor (OMF) lipoprotein
MIARVCSLSILAVAAGLAGCTLGPRYQPPTPPAPASQAFTAAAPAIASTDQPPADWWRLYNTPAINALVQQALTHNLTLEAAALSLARSNLLPTTTASAGAQYGVSDNEVLVDKLKGVKSPQPGWFYSVGLDASYEVDLFGRVRGQITAAKQDYEAQAAAMDAARISVAGETARAYVNACAYAQELKVAEQSLDLATQTYEVTVKQAQDGGVSDYEVARAHEAAQQAQAAVPGYAQQRLAALFALAVLTGQPPEQISQDAAACTATPKLATVLPVGDVQSLFRRRPDVRQAERQLAANVARIGVATADLYPTITIGGSIAPGAGTPSGLLSRSNLTYGVGPLLSWSFPNTLAAMAEIRHAQAVASASYANFQATVLQALQDVETSLSAYGAELDRNSALNGAYVQAQIAFKLAQSRFRDGSISYLDLITSQSDYLNSAAALASSDQALASDQVTVFKALGGGWEQAPALTPLPIVDGRTGQSIAVH